MAFDLGDFPVPSPEVSSCLLTVGLLCTIAAADTDAQEREPDASWGGGLTGRKRRRNEHETTFIDTLVCRWLDLPDRDFRRQLRVSKRVFHQILSVIGPVLDAESLAETNKRRRLHGKPPVAARQHLRPDTIPSNDLIVIALFQMGLRGESARVSDTLHVSTSTVRNALRRFCRAVNATWGNKISFGGVHNINALGDHGETRWGLPGCIGAIDGKRFRVSFQGRAHLSDGRRQAWSNYKYGTSFCIVAIADHHRRCLWLSDFWPGSVGDGRAWEASDFSKACDAGVFPPVECKTWAVEGENLRPYWLSDSGLPGSTYCVKGVSERSMVRSDRVFNRAIGAARKTVECLWGDLVNRFQIFSAPLQFIAKDEDDVEARYMELTRCALVLQNVCVDARDVWDEHHRDPELEGDDDPPPPTSKSGKTVQAALYAHVNKRFEVDPDSQQLRAKRGHGHA